MRRTDGLLLDPEPLVLLVVGLTSLSLISNHKRTSIFAEADFRLLEGIVKANQCAITPNVATEVSNHLRHYGEPGRTQLMRTFATLMDRYIEIYVPSEKVIRDRGFPALGLTDAALMACPGNRRIVTTDTALYVLATNRGLDVVNFHHLRAAAGLA